MAIKILFWIFFFVVFYTYLGYGLLIWALNKLVNNAGRAAARTGGTDFEPPVALIIAAFNEEDYIEDKIKNTLALDYPAEKLGIYFITDGSNDRTPDIIKKPP